jgi:hypothetical protein
MLDTQLPYVEGIDNPVAAVSSPMASQIALGTEYDSAPSSRPLKLLFVQFTVVNCMAENPII